MTTPAVEPVVTDRQAAPRTTKNCAVATASVGVVVAAVALSGFVPAEAATFVWLGFGLAVLTSWAGVYVLSRCTTVPNDDPARTAQLYLSGLAGNFGLQAIAVAVGMVAFSFAGEKFPALAAFGLSFAATALLIQLAGALAISRFLRERARNERDSLAGDSQN